MKKKNLLLAGIMILSVSLISQFANSQTCSGDEILMSKGCTCGYKKSQCESRCVRPNQVKNLLKQGWYYGECYDCCPWVTINSKADSVSVAEVSVATTVVFKCNYNCSHPNYALSKNQLKDCLSYCYRYCELVW